MTRPTSFRLQDGLLGHLEDESRAIDLDVLLATARDDLPAFLAATRVAAASMTDAEGWPDGTAR